jgi:hypothetical protein
MFPDEEIERRLGFKPMRPGQQALYEANRAKFIEVSKHVNALGSSREVATALTAIQEALMWTNAAIACNGIGIIADAMNENGVDDV